MRFASIRPRFVSVAAVVWLYVGPLWTLTGLLALAMAGSLARLADAGFAWLDILPYLAAALVVCGAMGLGGALSLLQLRSLGCTLVRIASWGGFAALQLFAWRVAYGLSLTPSFFGEPTFTSPQRGFPVALAGLALGTPFLVIARKLRSDEVRFAIRDAESQQPF